MVPTTSDEQLPLGVLVDDSPSKSILAKYTTATSLNEPGRLIQALFRIKSLFRTDVRLNELDDPIVMIEKLVQKLTQMDSRLSEKGIEPEHREMYFH